MQPLPERPYEDKAWLAQHLREERAEADLLSEIREALFGMQDGLVSTLAVVSTVGGATNDRFPILVAGLASALAGVFSMAAGEYLSSKSQREIFLAQVEKEREEVHGRPGESEAEVAYMLEQEGLDEAAAKRVADPPQPRLEHAPLRHVQLARLGLGRGVGGMLPWSWARPSGSPRSCRSSRTCCSRSASPSGRRSC
ncbi:MAG: VIT1/CCC1 transporter family protein [Candidatus Rokubacteria bacterium]|nr:VIT1/CCC1 transporter family protein [Candidatus Rokubacteria bacterium]